MVLYQKPANEADHHEWPSSWRANGEAESGAKLFKSIPKKCEDRTEIWANWRTTKFIKKCHNPSQLLMGRNVRTKLPRRESEFKPFFLNTGFKTEKKKPTMSRKCTGS